FKQDLTGISFFNCHSDDALEPPGQRHIDSTMAAERSEVINDLGLSSEGIGAETTIPDSLAENLIIERLIVHHLIQRYVPIKQIRAARCLKLKLQFVLAWDHKLISRLEITKFFNKFVVFFLESR